MDFKTPEQVTNPNPWFFVPAKKQSERLMNYIKANKNFWNNQSRNKSPWSRPVSAKAMEKAKSGKPELFITPTKAVPQGWLTKSWKGLDVLGVACGGGQQMPLLSGAGANVTSFDFSKEQLSKDREVCQRERLNIKTREGEMEDLTAFPSASFDFVINGVSVCYTKNVKKVWRGIYRVLRPGGILITGFTNPVIYSFNREDYELRLIHKIPYSGLKVYSDKERRAVKNGRAGFEFSHSLSDLIGGQTAEGFKITGLFEDRWGKGFKRAVDSLMPSFICVRSVK